MTIEAAGHFSGFLDPQGEEPSPNTGFCADTLINSGLAPSECLLEQIAMGDREAISIFLSRHGRTVRNVGLKVLQDEGEAQDLAQEVFLEIWNKAPAYDPNRGEVVTWIINLAYSRALDRRRHLNARRFYSSEAIDDRAIQIADPRIGPTTSGNTLASNWRRRPSARFTAA